MVEALTPVSPQDVVFVNPRACQADVNAKIVADGEILGASVFFDCRRCNKNLNFDLVGPEGQVFKDMRIKIAAICPKLKGKKVASNLLPSVNFL